MNKHEVPKRGGGVQVATQLVKTKEVIDKNGNTVKIVVEKPGEKRQMRPINKISERIR
jgi:hypothetical protein